MRATARAGFVFTASEIRMLAGHFSTEDGRGSVGYRKVLQLNANRMLWLSVLYVNALSLSPAAVLLLLAIPVPVLYSLTPLGH